MAVALVSEENGRTSEGAREAEAVGESGAGRVGSSLRSKSRRSSSTDRRTGRSAGRGREGREGRGRERWRVTWQEAEAESGVDGPP